VVLTTDKTFIDEDVASIFDLATTVRVNGGLFPKPKKTLDAIWGILPLSSRGTEVFTCVPNDDSNNQIASLFHIGENKVKNHISSAIHQRNANYRTQAVVINLSQKWLLI
jgi:DNA-binding NarL/FixJ family response regulator